MNTKKQQHKLNIDLLSFISTSYLLLPVIIFLISWTNIVVAISSSILIVLAGVFLYKKTTITNNFKKLLSAKNAKRILIISLVVLFIWEMLSGIGGFARQSVDYVKHDEILGTLINMDWPCKLGSHKYLYLIYYIAYYLPAACIGKILPAVFVNITLILWSYIGLAIALLWIFKIFKKITLVPLILLILFGGLDILGFLICGYGLPEWGYMFVERWTILYPLQTFTSQLFFAPQMFIPGLITSFQLIYLIFNKKLDYTIYISLACMPLWAPLVMVGLVPYFVVYIIVLFKEQHEFLEIFRPLIVVVSILLFSVLFSYITSNSHINDVFCFIWQNITSYSLVITLAALALKVVAIYLLLFFNRKMFSNFYLVNISLIFLLVVSIFQFGEYNDLIMRASIPSQIVFYLFFTKLCLNILEMKHGKKKIVLSVITCIFIATMSFPAVWDIISAPDFTFLKISRHISPDPMERPNKVFSPYNGSIKNYELKDQYLGSGNNSIFWEFIAKKS